MWLLAVLDGSGKAEAQEQVAQNQPVRAGPRPCFAKQVSPGSEQWPEL